MERRGRTGQEAKFHFKKNKKKKKKKKKKGKIDPLTNQGVQQGGESRDVRLLGKQRPRGGREKCVRAKSLRTTQQAARRGSACEQLCYENYSPHSSPCGILEGCLVFLVAKGGFDGLTI